MTAPTSSSSPFPFASAPDIVRAHQKDGYFTGQVANQLTDLWRRIAGARAAHARAPELHCLGALLYLGLTTLPGNRTLGEEYCHVVQVEARAGRLPALEARAAYVVGAVVVPYLVARLMPRVRAGIRAALHRRRASLAESGDGKAFQARLIDYLSRHVSGFTSTAPLQALTLAFFYFQGSYYELSKRLLNLRYLFTRSMPDTPDRAGYEVLGVLLAIQLAVQSYLHVRANLVSSPDSDPSPPLPETEPPSEPPPSTSPSTIQTPTQPPTAATNTPVAPDPRFDLADASVMAYIRGAQQRRCTLCLDPLRDPSATQCGHVFCWRCIADWVREKPECPLCRREALVQHILPLRALHSVKATS
ncbi:RING-1 like protein [Ophiocordyceps camponoti-floridani]|uniref:RING-type E3 ubiquitin transferase n=1 Tax=Ophiocordyceps camponoti-floridani TaxID=2030778 RepID=A0A8H4QBN8_9HYPO|nr:RING-1 like protein [Ophiocordyceps camponoti-floridani]